MSADGVDAVRCEDLAVAYGRARVLDRLSLAVSPGEVLALLGPSGSGKSTLLHALAGFLPAADGEIWLGGRRVAGPRTWVPPERRDVAMVFQNYALWPHLSALDTVAYPFRRGGAGRRAARERAVALLERLGIGRLADRRPAQLSGGEQQRVGLARALARDAGLYLFDEPTAHLDAHLRARFAEELVERQRGTGAAAVYATHDAEEALALSDRMMLLDAGRVVQVGEPAQVYAEPVSVWAARLTGPASLLRAGVAPAGDGRVSLDVGGVRVEVPGAGIPGAGIPGAGIHRSVNGSSPAYPEGRERAVLLRPDWAAAGGRLPGRARGVWFRGPHTDYLLDTPGGDVLVRSPGPPRHRVGDRVGWELHRAWLLPDLSDLPGVQRA